MPNSNLRLLDFTKKKEKTKRTKYAPVLARTRRGPYNLFFDPRIKKQLSDIALYNKQSVSWTIEQVLIDYFSFEHSMRRVLRENKRKKK